MRKTKAKNSLAQRGMDTVRDRRENYGAVRESFGRIARLWSVALDKTITPEDVAICMILFKTSREMHKHKEDNLTDIVGYTACLDELYRGPQDACAGAKKTG